MKMDYRLVGNTGIKVSPLCMGTMSFGGDADEATSKAMFDRCREVGINFFDTANAYSNGKSEEILGRCIKDSRDELVLTTKVWSAMGSKDINAKGISRRNIMKEVENSLQRLGTDRIEFYFVHMFDSEPAIEETLRALDDLQRDGKILFPACSNWAAWQMAKALGISDKEGYARFACIQPMYNLVKRQAEVEILPFAKEENLGVMTYSPLGGGLLSGKYKSSDKLSSGRLVDNDKYVKRYAERQYYDVAERFTQYAQERDIHPATLAVSWANSHPAVTAAIIGARNLEQLEPSLRALDVDMTEEWREEITALSITPPSATDRSEEM